MRSTLYIHPWTSGSLQSRRSSHMDLCVTIKGVSFLLQTGLGILANALVLLAYAHISLTEARLAPVDSILSHLAFADLLLLLTRGVPQTMTVFGLRNLLDDAGCKVVIYVYRVARALSVCITCMLSVFQATTVDLDLHADGATGVSGGGRHESVFLLLLRRAQPAPYHLV